MCITFPSAPIIRMPAAATRAEGSAGASHGGSVVRPSAVVRGVLGTAITACCVFFVSLIVEKPEVKADPDAAVLPEPQPASTAAATTVIAVTAVREVRRQDIADSGPSVAA